MTLINAPQSMPTYSTFPTLALAFPDKVPGSEPEKPPNDPEKSKVLRAICFGAVGGTAGRLGTNNLTQMTANYQSGRFKVDLSLATLQGMLVGANLQMATTYGLRAYLNADQAAPGSLDSLVNNSAAGFAGSFFIHPSSVAFFINESDRKSMSKVVVPEWIRGSAELSDIARIVKANPKLLLRGLSTRGLIGAADWGLYLTGRDLLANMVQPELGGGEALIGGERQPVHPAVDLAAASISTMMTTPLYQLYIAQIRGETGKVAAESMRNMPPPNRARLLAVNVLFNAWAALERYIVDNTQSSLEKQFPSSAR